MFRIAFTAASLAAASVVSAATSASSVASYSAGTGVGAYTNTAAAVGLPAALVGELDGFPNVFSPFSPAYETSKIVGVGAGGHLTLQFAQPINVIAGPEFGVINNVFLIDAGTDGTATNPAATFPATPRVGDIEVSADGNTFFPVGRVTFSNPANYFRNAPSPYLASITANLFPADFGQPFIGSLSSFDGETWPQILDTLNGSGGGTWIDVGAAGGLSAFSFVRLSVPDGGIAGSDNRFYVDSVVANNAAVPEPAAAFILLATCAALRRRG